MTAREMFEKLNCTYEEDEVFIDIKKRYSVDYEVLINKDHKEMFITFTDRETKRSIVTLLCEKELKAFASLIKEQERLDE